MVATYLIGVHTCKEQGRDSLLLKIQVERGLSAPDAAHPAQRELQQHVSRHQASRPSHWQHARMRGFRRFANHVPRHGTWDSFRDAGNSPILVDPDVRARVAALFVEALERAVELGVELAAHEEAAEAPRELCAEAAVAALHEAADEGGRYCRQLVLGQAPVSVSQGLPLDDGHLEYVG